MYVSLINCPQLVRRHSRRSRRRHSRRSRRRRRGM